MKSTIKVNSNAKTYQAPFRIMIVNEFDQHLHVDLSKKIYYPPSDLVGGKEEIFARTDTFELAKTIANALFISKNFMWNNLDEMKKSGKGQDVRVYDAKHKLVYLTHTKFEKKWIKGAHFLKDNYWNPSVNFDLIPQFRKKFEEMTDEELISSFNADTGHSGWNNARSQHIEAMKEEFKKRKFDDSVIKNKSGGWSLAKKIKLVDHKEKKTIEIIN